MRYDLVAFDLDGTLVDSIVDIAGALNFCLRERGYHGFSVQIVRTLVGEGVNSLVRKALARQPAGEIGGAGPSGGGDDAEVEAIAQAIWNYYLEHPCVDSQPFAGMVETLESLQQRGCRLVVLTNKPGPVSRQLLDALELTRFFGGDVIGDGDGFPRKPDPAGARELMRRAATSNSRMLMVGDGLPDVLVAQAAGCDVAAALWGYTPELALRAKAPTFALSSPRELLAVVAGQMPKTDAARGALGSGG